jgi:hypothetical protein
MKRRAVISGATVEQWNGKATALLPYYLTSLRPRLYATVNPSERGSAYLQAFMCVTARSVGGPRQACRRSVKLPPESCGPWTGLFAAARSPFCLDMQ